MTNKASFGQDSTKATTLNEMNRILDDIIKNNRKNLDDDLGDNSSIPENSSITDLQEIRNKNEIQNIKHRERLLNHVLGFEYISISTVLGLIASYVIFRFLRPDDPPLISDLGLDILIIGFFCEITGLLYIASRYLWWRPKYSNTSQKNTSKRHFR